MRTKYLEKDIEVDGGVKPATVDVAAKAGANMIVSGSGVSKTSAATLQSFFHLISGKRREDLNKKREMLLSSHNNAFHFAFVNAYILFVLLVVLLTCSGLFCAFFLCAMWYCPCALIFT